MGTRLDLGPSACMLNSYVYYFFGLWRSRKVGCVFKYQTPDCLLYRHKYCMHLVMRQRNFCICLAYAIKNLELSVISRP